MSSSEEKNHAPARNAEGNGLRKYEFTELAEASRYFSNGNRIARGRFGDVYKGVDVAIKKLDISEDDHWEKKFQDLIKAFGTVHHENLVKLIGYCSSSSDKLLVSEFVSNKSLKFYLYDEKKRSNLTWARRMKIAKDTAKGLAHLHEGSPPIIHGDIKAANILLDHNFNPKVAEFGLDNLYPKNDHKNHPSQSVDVYSFGIVLLELIMGKNVGKRDISKAKSIMEKLKKKGNYSLKNDDAGLIDPNLIGHYDASEMSRMIYCVAISISKPLLSSMKQIVEVLEGAKELQSFNSQQDPSPHNGLAFNYGPKKFEYKVLADATDGFSNQFNRGRGGFGVVYEASLTFQRHTKDHKTHTVAIKKLTYEQDDNPGKEEFEKEIKAVGAARHRNLVELIGYCSTKHDKLLVLEFVSNKSLRYHLHGNKTLTLDWSKRMKIARSAAKALAYLHDDDFGLVKFFPQTDSVTHITTAVNKGTYIYADLDSKQVSEKSDVYSFGVVLLELITGRDPFMDDGIVKWATSLPQMIEGDDLIKVKDDFVDSKLRGVYDESEVKQMVYCAAASVYKPPISRPTMKQIVQVLTGKLSPENLWSAESPPRQVNPDKKSRKPNPNEQNPSTLLQQFKYEDLASATKAFSGEYRRRKDSCFEVYEAVISSGSNYEQNVTIKKLIHFSAQQKDEFEGEIKTIVNVRHRNIVKLIGYCSDEHNNRLLVFESTSGKSLKSCLHAEEGKNSADLLWPTRMKIAQGIANALKYMHEDCKPRILHLFVKLDNIFLNEKFEPKLAEFGSAEFFPESATHVSIDKMMKDSGYLAPEYDSSNKKHLTDKFDVYSFGVILLELITGKQSVVEFDRHETTLVKWMLAMPQFKRSPFKGEGKENFVDEKLKEYDIKQMDRMIACALACIHDNPQKRPQMCKILDVLEGIADLETLNLLP
ncbi:hypothetical protein MANES_11G043701v8 [Manihot esculenta]|uniref:Uncharacterized protein n=1 Tax=Manihot esculenta TaxID=3983 RepID=A0ACB7GUU5_MANES|nr:hypothetical protein MANES_11G043701v8 [Manihot esculenta]